MKVRIGPTLLKNNTLPASFYLKIKNKAINYDMLSNELKELISEKGSLPDNYEIGDDGKLYFEQYGKYYPVSHPDISTQPSILSQRFGNCPIKEVLVKEVDGHLDPIIPSEAVIISAQSFNTSACVPATCMKINGVWTITNSANIVPDFTLIKYYEFSGNYYYSGGDTPEPGREVIKTFTLPAGSKTMEGISAESIWGTSTPSISLGDIIGFTESSAGRADLVVEVVESSYTCTFLPSESTNRLVLWRANDSSIDSALDFDITFKFYAL